MLQPFELRREPPPQSPDWDSVSEVHVYDRLTPAMKKIASAALAHHKVLVSMTPEALDSLDQYITGANT